MIPRIIITVCCKISQLSRAFLASLLPPKFQPFLSFYPAIGRTNPRPNNAMRPDAMEYASNPMHPVHRRGLPPGRSNRATSEGDVAQGEVAVARSGTKVIYPSRLISSN